MQQITHKDTIQLKFKVAGLLNRDLQKANNVFCKIFLKNGNQQELLITQTDVSRIHSICNWEIYFSPFTMVDFIFELLQTLRLEIYERSGQDIDQLIAQVKTNVGQIISSTFLEIDIISTKNIGKLNIGKQMAQEENEYDYNTSYMIWQGQNLLDTEFFGTSDPFLIFYKMMYEKWEKVIETYYIKDNLNPTWKVMEISDDLLYKDNTSQLIKIECWDHSKSGKHKFIGETITSKNEIADSKREFILSNNGKTKGFGTLKLLKYQRGHIPKFIDFLMQEKLNLIMGIDFTGSNGNPESFESLHNINNDKLNQYQQTLKVFGDILLNYTDGRNTELFGFGGIPKGQNKAKFCFPLNDKEKHPLKNTNDILQVYDTSVRQVKQSGPTYVAELLKYARKQAKNIEKGKFYTFQYYQILLIITDGIINDMAETKQLIQDCEQLPISVIFIGVGNEDFSEMKKVFSQPELTRNNYRQIHQFESFKEYNDPDLLMQAVLKKIPEQYLRYKKINGRAPFNCFQK